MSLEVFDSVGLIKLFIEPLAYSLRFSSFDTVMPNFSGLVIGVGGKVIFGEPSLNDRGVELSLIDLQNIYKWFPKTFKVKNKL